MSFRAKLFWDKVQVGGLDDCWTWLGGMKNSGYGNFRTGSRHGLSSYPHRTSYLLTHGSLNPGQRVLHSCDNPICCNPCHVRGGDQQDNMNDKVSRGRQAKGAGSTTPVGEKHPKAKFTEDQVRGIINSPLTIAQLASQWGVSRCCISNIKHRKTWRHI